MKKDSIVAKPRKHQEKDKRLEAAKGSVKIKTIQPLEDSNIREFIQKTEGRQFKDV